MIDAAPLTPQLWIGARPPEGAAVARAGFDTLVLCEEAFQPAAAAFPGVEVLRCPFLDRDRPLEAQAGVVDQVLRTAEAVSMRVNAGRRTLVVCHQGRNRSGLVCALALVELGVDPERASRRVRDARLGGLSNMHFRGFVSRVRRRQ